ncbi:MAG: hypothetical protein ABIG96_04885 [Candidatus Micrarchaeota archaeon]
MGSDFEIYLAAGGLLVATILFGILVKRSAKVFNSKYSRLERKANDVAMYLSHINEDKVHLEKLAGNKIEQQWALMHISSAFSDYKKESAPARSRIRITVAAKQSD